MKTKPPPPPTQQQQYYTSVDEIHPNIQSQSTVHVNQRVLPVGKPLRIIIIRHAERADAVLGSDWSKKSFDRTGRYIRFSEHLPDAYDYSSIKKKFFLFLKKSILFNIDYQLVHIYIIM